MKKDYSLGKIYKIIDNTSDLFYLGSTCYSKLSQRLAKHRGHLREFEKGTGRYVSSFEILNNDDYKIILLEDYPCDNIDQLTSREQYWMDKLKCDDMVNKHNAKGVNKERYKQTKKDYRQKNKKEISEKGKEKIQCDRCNAIIRKDGLSRHRKAKTCINSLPHGIINELAE